MAEIDKKNEEMLAELDDKQESLQDNINKLGADYAKKVQAGKNAAASLIAAQMKKLESEMVELENEKKKFKDGKWIKDYINESRKENSKWFFQKIDWKKPSTYGKLSLLIIILVVFVILIVWIVGKIKSLFVSEK